MGVGKNSAVSSERPKFGGYSEEICLEDVERSVQVEGGSVTVGCSMAEILRQEGIEGVCRWHRGKELFEFYHLKEASIEEAFIGLLNTQKTQQEGRLSRRIERGIHILHQREKETKIPQGF